MPTSNPPFQVPVTVTTQAVAVHPTKAVTTRTLIPVITIVTERMFTLNQPMEAVVTEEDEKRFQSLLEFLPSGEIHRYD